MPRRRPLAGGPVLVIDVGAVYDGRRGKLDLGRLSGVDRHQVRSLRGGRCPTYA